MKAITDVSRIFHIFAKSECLTSTKVSLKIWNINKNNIQSRFYSTNIKEHSLNSAEIVTNSLRIHYHSQYFDFPLVWLRDNCQCQECFHTTSKSRIIHWKNFDVNIKPKELIQNSDTVKIIWNDNHISAYSGDWLHERNFTLENERKYLNKTYKPVKVPWDKGNFENIFKNFEFSSLLKDNNCLEDWLRALSTYGVAVIKGVPSSPKSCQQIANRVDFIKRTHYGEEFTVQAKPGTTNVAYLSSNLQLHTDLPYYEYKPGVNLLHCVTQSTGAGGDNLLSDGLFVANYLKEHSNESYKILSETLVDWEDIGEEKNNRFHSIFRSPVICENLNGEIIRINHSVPQRGSHFNIPIEKVKPWYDAMKMFVDLVYEQSASFKMMPGDILCFDNRRLLHGRTEYEDTPENIRHVIGVYLDWDYIYSRLRVISNNR